MAVESMHRSLVERLLCPACRDERSSWNLIPFRAKGEIILDGVLQCAGCSAWYPVQDAVLDLVAPSLWDPKAVESFAATYAGELAAATCRIPTPISETIRPQAQMAQREHFDWYADNEKQDYTAYQNTPFWRAEDALVFSAWKQRIAKPGGWLLDVGCADGRCAFQWRETVGHVAGCDISRKMICKAVARARELGVEDRMSFFVADADALPLRDGSFDYASTYGVLHHLPNPGRTYRDIIRVLKPGGILFASENSTSAFRGLFDFLMKLLPLWTELAGEEPLLSRSMISDWARDLPVELKVRHSVFVPPHLLNLAGHRLAQPLLRFTDGLCRHIPWLREQGGLIVCESRKREQPSPSP